MAKGSGSVAQSPRAYTRVARLSACATGVSPWYMRDAAGPAVLNWNRATSG